MIQGVYGAATALENATQAQDATAQNLAHVNVPGYRARGLSFETFDQTLAGKTAIRNLYGTQVSRTYSNFNGGPVQHTGNPLDVAVGGNDFFVVQGPNGPLYTRNGIFSADATGQIVSQSGLPVLGEAGPLTIPAVGNVSRLTIGENGSVRLNDVDVGRIRVVRFADPSQLTPTGTTLYAAPDGVNPEAAQGKVLQGYREASNVEPASELITMIRTTRYAEAAQRALRALSDSLQLTTRPT